MNRGKFESVEAHAQQMSKEVKRLLSSKLKPIRSAPKTTINSIKLDFDPLPSREDWVQMSAESNRFSFYGKKMLAKIDRGETLVAVLSDVVVENGALRGDAAV